MIVLISNNCTAHDKSIMRQSLINNGVVNATILTYKEYQQTFPNQYLHQNQYNTPPPNKPIKLSCNNKHQYKKIGAKWMCSCGKVLNK